jgi:peptidoglycan/xylan/chitin deacetylase (PgdA/CDA1 family)
MFALALLTGSAQGQELPSREPGYQQLLTNLSHQTPLQWGERVSGVKTHLDTRQQVVVLTLDACGSPKGKGYDHRLIDFLIAQRIPATLFINSRWIEANPAVFAQLAANPLFEIANHGTWHKPASVNGRTVYGITGTRSPAELLDEIEINTRLITSLTGIRPRYYRSGTAYYDEVAVSLATSLKQTVIGYSVLGDAGATYRSDQVRQALLKSRPGDIILAHMNHPESGTADGIITAIPELLRRGFRFVHLHQYPLR